MDDDSVYIIIAAVFLAIVLLIAGINGIGFCTDEYYAGLCHNSCTLIGGACYDCERSGEKPIEGTHYTDLRAERYSNSDGVGLNGYITLRVTMQVITGIYECRLKYQIYDNGTLVGTAYENIYNWQKSLYDEKVYEHYTNIAVDNYIAGNYTIEVTMINGDAKSVTK